MNADGGVRVQVSRDVDGERAVETYEADSMSALLERHPLLAERLHLGQRPGLAWTRASAVRLHARDPWSAEEVDPVARTDVLGVIVVPLEPSAGGFPGHPETAGVRVKKVVEQTIAARLGVRAGDVLLEVNGIALEHDDDISTAMRQRREEGEVNVVLVDRFGRERSRTWKPAPPAAE
jgi:S1-C subfamily serine protease